MQISGGSGWSTTPPEIQLDINEGTSGLAVGGTITYGTGGNTMKVKYQQNNYAGTNFDFYIHTLANGGKFTLRREIKNGASDAGSLDANISDVYEVYYYVKTADNKGALKIKIMGETKIFYSTAISSSSTWKNEANDPVGTTDPELKALVNDIKEWVEIKLEKTGVSTYTATPAGGDITVAEDTTIDGFKGSKHSYTSAMTINRITFKGTPIRGIPELDNNGTINIAGNNKVWVFYENNDSNRDKPLLLYFKKSDDSSNNWYGKGKKWEKDMDLSTIDASAGLNSLGQTDKDKIQSKLNGMLEQGTMSSHFYTKTFIIDNQY